MRTDFERETQPATADNARSRSWVWGIVLALIVVLLAIWAISAVRYTNNALAPAATQSSVQNSGTGEQESVGHFRGQIVPNTQSNQGSGAPGAANGLPAAGYTMPQAKGPAQSEPTEGSSAGAGNSGITPGSDTIGGAPVLMPNGKQANVSSHHTPGQNNGTTLPQ